jgi:RNA polymerase sigma-70 factor (ECF subfamily)
MACLHYTSYSSGVPFTSLFFGISVIMKLSATDAGWMRMNETSVSLLERLRQEPDEKSWQQLVELYTPLIHAWLSRQEVQLADRHDLVQEVLAIVVRKLPGFEHNQRTGAFRHWLRTITARCLKDFWRAQRLRPVAHGDSDFQEMLQQLEDPHSALSRQWDRDHDLHVTRKLLEMLQPQFTPVTWEAFQRVALLRESPEAVATALGLTVNAVFIAKSRVLTKLRQEAQGLLE